MSEHRHRVVAQIFSPVDDAALAQALREADLSGSPADVPVQAEGRQSDRTAISDSPSNPYSSYTNHNQLVTFFYCCSIITMMFVCFFIVLYCQR